MTARAHLLVRAGATLFALAGVAAWAWRPATADGPADAAAAAAAGRMAAATMAYPLVPAVPLPSLSDAFGPPAQAPAGAGPIATAAAAGSDPAGADLPEVVGLAGRLPDDVEVLVRNGGGGTTALRIGQADAGGWRLVSVAADRAVFERAGEQRAVVLGTGG